MSVKVKGLLVEGKDGREYLLGIGPRQKGSQKERPTVWRRDGDAWVSLEQTREASVTVRSQLGLDAPLQPGLTHDEHVKWAVLESAAALLSRGGAEPPPDPPVITEAQVDRLVAVTRDAVKAVTGV